MAKLTQIGVVFMAKLQAIILAFIGLITGIFYSVGGLLYDIISTGSVNSGTTLAFVALIAMPIIFASFGFILGAVGAVLYNFSSSWFGGIEMDPKP